MKIIKIRSGEIRHGYELEELTPAIQEQVIAEHIEFEISIMGDDKDHPYMYLAEEMERMKTPWFLSSEIYRKHKADIIDSIKINEYLFDKKGEMLPILRTYEKNKLIKTEFEEEECTIE